MKANTYIQIYRLVRKIRNKRGSKQTPATLHRPSSALLYLGLCGGVFAADQIMKKRAKKLRPGQKVFVMKVDEKNKLEGAVGFTRVHNYGACMNLGEHHPEAVKKVSLALTGITAAGFAAALAKSKRPVLKLGLSLLTGGALSNAADRLRDGYVTDYITFPKIPGKLKSVVYNMGDFAIAAGAVLTALSLGKEDRKS